MSEYSYKAGFDRGNEGKSSSSGLFDGFLEGEEDTKDREEGFKAGLLAHAIRECDDED